MELRAPEPQLLRELSALLEIARLPRFWGQRAALPRGERRVLVVPGFMTADGSTWILRRILSSLGHDVHGWKLGRNRGNVEELLQLLLQRLDVLCQDEPIHLVGWSLGGYLAREMARERPDQVAQVITLASPVVGGPKYTAAAKTFRDKLGADLDEIETEVARRNAVPLTTPVTAMYSPTDTVVCPAACIDHHHRHVQHVAVNCTHAGFGFCPEVLTLIAERLAHPPQESV